MTTDHTCPVEWAADRGLLEGSPVDRSWCLSHQMDTVTSLEPVNAMAPELLLWQQGALRVFYAPWDWVNTSAKVMLVGITPGLYQATERSPRPDVPWETTRASDKPLPGRRLTP